MSAYVVSKEHIDCLVDAALTRQYDCDFQYYYGDQWHRVDTSSANELGAMLWTENIRSVCARYDDCDLGDLPGPVPTPKPDAYRHNHIPFPVNPIVALKAIACYVYQSCETDDWEESEAYAFCQALKDHMIGLLPGYEDGPGWDITDREVYRRVAA